MMDFHLEGKECPNCGHLRFFINSVGDTCPHCRVSPELTFSANFQTEHF
jgi:uncharacterized OB-fold protein